MKNKVVIVLLAAATILIAIAVVFSWQHLQQTQTQTLVATWQTIQTANREAIKALLSLPEEASSRSAAIGVINAHLDFLDQNKTQLAIKVGTKPEGQAAIEAIGRMIEYFEAAKKAIKEPSEKNMTIVYATAATLYSRSYLPEVLQNVPPPASQTTMIELQAKIRKLGQLKNKPMQPTPKISLPSSPEYAEFRARVRRIIREYEATRHTFQLDLNRGVAEYTQYDAYQQRVAIRNKLLGLRRVAPVELIDDLDYLIDTVDMAINATIDYAETKDRDELRRISRIISARLERSKRVF